MRSGSLLRRVIQLLTGLFLYGFGLAMMVRAAIGVAPWDVLSQGISQRTGWSFGLVTVLTSVGVLVLWIPLRERPGVGTVANVLMLGPSAEVGLWLVPAQTEPVPQILLFGGGLSLVAVATGLYIGTRFGAGARDGLMTGLHRRTGYPIWAVRTSIEVAVLTAGWILGGNVGIGTLAFALLIGPMAGVTLPLFRLRGPAEPAAQASGVIA